MFGEPQEALRLVDTELPKPPPGLLRVRVAACALGLPDLLMCRGSYALTPELPFTPGQELVGEVTVVGEGARVRVGDRIMAVSAFFLKSGGFAREALALDEFAFRVPDDMEDAEAAGFVIPYHTAHVGLVRRAVLQAGETLLVLGGAGGTGSAAIRRGRALGAKVLATAGGEDAAGLLGVRCEQRGGGRRGELLAPVQYLDMIQPRLVDGFRGRYELERPGESLLRVEWTYHSQAAGRGRFDVIFWEIEDAPSSLPRLHPRGVA